MRSTIRNVTIVVPELITHELPSVGASVIVTRSKAGKYSKDSNGERQRPTSLVCDCICDFCENLSSDWISCCMRVRSHRLVQPEPVFLEVQSHSRARRWGGGWRFKSSIAAIMLDLRSVSICGSMTAIASDSYTGCLEHPAY